MTPRVTLPAYDARVIDPLNAVVTWCEDTAPAPAGPLSGVRFTVKDALAVAGVPSQAGSRAFAGYTPAEDAPAVARLRAAGAVLVGKTNCSELALTPWTGNELFGETRHPFAPGRSPGGSSGGCAAAIASRLVPLSLGTDYGGSVRLPAVACGIVALRPTPGRIPAGGQIPPAPPDSPRAAYSVVGPLAADLDLLYRALAALDPDGVDPLPEAPAPLTDEAPPFLQAAEDCFTALRALDTFEDLRPLADQLGPALRHLVERAPRTLDQVTHRRLTARAGKLREEADEFMAEHPLLVLPVTRGALPPPAGAPVPFEHLGPCRAVSLLGLPAVAVGQVQIVARRGHDEEAIAAAARLSETTGWALTGPR
jgi:amidase